MPRESAPAATGEVLGTLSEEGNLPHRDYIAPGVNAKIESLLGSGARFIESNGGVSMFLEAPVSVLSRPGIPKVLQELAASNVRDRMRVELISRGHGLGFPSASAYTEEYAAIQIAIVPRILDEPLTTYRISQTEDEFPVISFRNGSEDIRLIYNKRLVKLFLRVADLSTDQWGGIDDYVEDLRRISEGEMTLKKFAVVEHALRFASDELMGQFRKSGEPAVEHSYRAIRHAMQAGIFDASHLGTLGLHDVPEDSPDLSQRGRPYKEWSKSARVFFTDIYGGEIAKRVIVLTRPMPDGDEVPDSQKSNQMYVDNILGNPSAAFDKIFDRLDNVETLDSMPVANQIRTVRETIDYIRTIFMNEKVKAVNPQAWAIAMRRLVTALEPYSRKYHIEIPEDILALKI